MKKIPKKVPRYVHALLDKFIDLFDVRTWDISLTIEENKKSDRGDDAAAQIEVDEEYRRIRITFYRGFWEAGRRYQREYLLHEFCHLATNSLFHLLDEFKAGRLVTPQQIRKENEAATSRVAQILDGFLTDGWKTKRKAYQDFMKKPKPTRKLRKRQRV